MTLAVEMDIKSIVSKIRNTSFYLVGSSLVYALDTDTNLEDFKDSDIDFYTDLSLGSLSRSRIL